MQGGLSIVDHALTAFKDDKGTLGYVIWLVILLAAGFTAGSAGLAHSSGGCVPPARANLRSPVAPMRPRSPPPIRSPGPRGRRGPPARAPGRVDDRGRDRVHNFAEGFAIGVSARAGAISLATVLSHRLRPAQRHRGFGIVGPLGDVKPSWKWRPRRPDRRRPDVPRLDRRLAVDRAVASLVVRTPAPAGRSCT